MKLEYSATIGVPVDEAWSALGNLGRVIGNLPRVRLTGDSTAASDGAPADFVTGTVTLPFGPFTLTYRGRATLVERDPVARRVVIDATGENDAGVRAASARIVAVLTPESPTTTRVDLEADVDVRGASAPIGVAIAAAGNGVLRQFVNTLADVGRRAHPLQDTGPAAEAAGVPPRTDAGVPPTGRRQPRPVRRPPSVRIRFGRPPLRGRRGVPVAAVFGAGVVAGWLLRGHRR